MSDVKSLHDPQQACVRMLIRIAHAPNEQTLV